MMMLAWLMSSMLTAAAGLPLIQGLSRTTLPPGEVSRKKDQPSHSSLTGPACAWAVGVVAGPTCAWAVGGAAGPLASSAVAATISPANRGLSQREDGMETLSTTPRSLG